MNFKKNIKDKMVEIKEASDYIKTINKCENIDEYFIKKEEFELHKEELLKEIFNFINYLYPPKKSFFGLRTKRVKCSSYGIEVYDYLTEKELFVINCLIKPYVLEYSFGSYYLNDK